MPYDGRAVMAEVAARHGWSVTEDMHGSKTPDGELVTYERYGTQILIEWTPENTGLYIVKNHGNPDQVVAAGATGLITARGWMESAA